MASAVFAVVGTLASTVGALGQAAAAQSAAEYNAKVDQRNAKIARDSAEADAADKARENRRQLGAIRAAYGWAGIDLAGSPLDVLEDTALEQELDVEKIKREGVIKQMQFNERATLSEMEADAYGASMFPIAIGGIAKAGTALLSNLPTGMTTGSGAAGATP